MSCDRTLSQEYNILFLRDSSEYELSNFQGLMKIDRDCHCSSLCCPLSEGIRPRTRGMSCPLSDWLLVLAITPLLLTLEMDLLYCKTSVLRVVRSS